MAIDTGINFVSVHLVDMTFTVNRKFKPPKDGTPVELGFAVAHTFSKDKKTLHTTLSASLFQKTANRPFSMNVSMEGTFTADDADKLKSFAAVHAPAHLMPFVRETIGNATMKAGIPPLLLPPINMHEALAIKEKAGSDS